MQCISIALSTLISRKQYRLKAGLKGPVSHSYGVSLAMWDHAVLPATQYKWTTQPALTLDRQASTRFTYHGRMEGWVDLGDRLYTEMVYPPTDGYPLKY